MSLEENSCSSNELMVKALENIDHTNVSITGFSKCTDQKSANLLKDCMKVCIKNIKVSLNVIDRLIGRSTETKLINECHMVCLRDNLRMIGVANIKNSGKWAFRRILGFTEFFSGSLALLCLFYNICFYYRRLNNATKDTVLRKLIMLHYFAMNAAFFSSAMFHCHENTLTTMMDYLTAVFSIFVYTASSVSRVLIRYHINERWITPFVIVIFLSYLLHILLNDINYWFHKHICGMLLTISSISKIFLIKTLRKKEDILSQKMHRHISIFLTITWISVFFETLDFPPIFFIIDSHAIWHLGLFLAIRPFHEFQILESSLPLLKLQDNRN